MASKLSLPLRPPPTTVQLVMLDPRYVECPFLFGTFSGELSSRDNYQRPMLMKRQVKKPQAKKPKTAAPEQAESGKLQKSKNIVS
jgi:hypothetical protein